MSGVAPARGSGLFYVLGPCVLESLDMALQVASACAAFGQRRGATVVFKASFDKANRSTVDAARGPGLDAGLRMLEQVRRETGLPVLTDVHESAQVTAVAEVVDVVQIPAFLCRQTDLLTAAGACGRPVHVKKGQFLPPHDMAHVREKLVRAGAPEVWLCERGTSFGHGDLVVDMRSLVWMDQIARDGEARDGVPTRVVFDATHSVQRRVPGAQATGGQREMVPALLRAAVAVGVDAVFAEVHPDPARAVSDAGSQWPLDELEALFASPAPAPAPATPVACGDIPSLREGSVSSLPAEACSACSILPTPGSQACLTTGQIDEVPSTKCEAEGPAS